MYMFQFSFVFLLFALNIHCDECDSSTTWPLCMTIVSEFERISNCFYSNQIKIHIFIHTHTHIHIYFTNIVTNKHQTKSMINADGIIGFFFCTINVDERKLWKSIRSKNLLSENSFVEKWCGFVVYMNLTCFSTFAKQANSSFLRIAQERKREREWSGGGGGGGRVVERHKKDSTDYIAVGNQIFATFSVPWHVNG